MRSLRVRHDWSDLAAAAADSFLFFVFFFHFNLILFFLIFFILFFNFTILYWFCHISKWIHHRYTCVFHSEPSSLLPHHTIPLGHPSAPAPSIQYRASNLDWRFISYMILYMFQCHSPKSSHPFPLPQSPKEKNLVMKNSIGKGRQFSWDTRTSIFLLKKKQKKMESRIKISMHSGGRDVSWNVFPCQKSLLVCWPRQMLRLIDSISITSRGKGSGDWRLSQYPSFFIQRSKKDSTR